MRINKNSTKYKYKHKSISIYVMFVSGDIVITALILYFNIKRVFYGPDQIIIGIINQYRTTGLILDELMRSEGIRFV